MKSRVTRFALVLSIWGGIAGCGAKEKMTEINNAIDVKGNWLMTQSEHANVIETALEKESMVLTFKDGKAAFSPTDSLIGRAAFALLSNCTVGPRPYHVDKNQIVFEAVAGCDEKRLTVQTLNDTTFKFPDPDNIAVIRTFRRIDDATYHSLVKASDRKL